MCRYVLIALVVAVVALMAVAVLVVSLYGWPGFLVLVVALFVLAFVLKKALPSLLPRLLMGSITRPMRQMGKVLRGATLTVHSITRCDPPPTMDDEEEEDEDDEPERLGDRDDPADEDDEEDEDDEDEADEDEPNPADLEWYRIEFTVTPRDAQSSEGRMVHRTAWSPGLLMFTLPAADRPPRPAGIPAIFEHFAAPEVQTDGIEVWTGAEFQEDSEADVYGEGRFRARVGVGRDVQTIHLVYAHFTPIGEIRIPRIDVTPGREP